MADAPTTQGTRLIDYAPAAVTEKLIRMQVGGCTCNTKSPELRFHDERCTYRLACEVQDLLNTAPTPSPPVAAPPATPDRYEAIKEMAYLLKMAPRGEVVAVEALRVLGTHYDAALKAAGIAAAQPQPQPAQPLTNSTEDAKWQES